MIGCCISGVNDNMNNEVIYENTELCQCDYNNCIRKIDVREIVNSFSADLLKSFTLKFNVYSCEAEVLEPCESIKIKTNIICKAYIPLTHTIQFFGFHNHLNIKAENKFIIPFQEEQIYVEICNFSDIRRRLPLHMPIGEIVIRSKDFTDFM